MAKPKSPEGKRVAMSVRFSEDEAAQIDAARGGVNRSEWLRSAALAFAVAGCRAPRRTPVAAPERLPRQSRKSAPKPDEPETGSDIVKRLFSSREEGK
jgi:hypothetical protein